MADPRRTIALEDIEHLTARIRRLQVVEGNEYRELAGIIDCARIDGLLTHVEASVLSKQVDNMKTAMRALATARNAIWDITR
jgi:hypothetical protein